MSVKFLDNTGLSYFWSKIKAWCNSLFALDSVVVHKTSNETIAGTKTFSSSPVAPTPTTSDNSTKVATTEFVKAQGYVTANTKVQQFEGILNANRPILSRWDDSEASGTASYVVYDKSITINPAIHTLTASGGFIGNVSGSSGSCTGNASTATKLATARTINGVSFDGSANITVADNTKLPLSGGTLTGGLTLKKSNITRGSSTTYVVTGVHDVVDSAGNRVGCLLTEYNEDKSSRTSMFAYNTTVASGGNIGRISIGCDSSGNVVTQAPTPATADNSTKIATTAFVKAQGYLTSHQSLANYVTLNGSQDITGAKRFTGGLARKHNAYDVTLQNPASTIWSGIGFVDKNDLTMFNFNFVQQTNDRALAVSIYDINKEAHWPFSIHLPADASSAAYLSLSHTYPMSSQNTLGNSSHKWGSVWAVNGTIQTSDERVKEDVNAIPDEVLDAWEQVEWLQFKMKDSVKEKGSRARLHSGVIAQRIKSAFDLLNIDPADYGFFCWDEWDAVPAFYSENGDMITDEIPAGEQYSIRYDEALAIEAAYMRRENARLKKRIAGLEERLAALELKIS